MELNNEQKERATQSLVSYFRTIADPLNNQANAIPDGVPIPMVCKTVAYSKSLSIPQSINGLDGLFLYLPGATRPQIRHYGYDRDAQTMNLLATIEPTEDLSLDYDYFRHVATGLSFLSNTVNGGAFAVQGIFNAIAFGSLFPVTETPPESLSQYKQNAYDVVSSVPVSTGVVAIPPLTDEFRFKRFRPDDIATPASATGDTADYSFYQDMEKCLINMRIPADRPINIPASAVATVRQVILKLPQPYPWGKFQYEGVLRIDNVLAITNMRCFLSFRQRTANPANYSEQTAYVVQDTRFSVSIATSNAGNVAQFEFSGCSDYFDGEIDEIALSVVTEAALPTSGTINAQRSKFCVTPLGYGQRDTRSSGVAISYQSLTEVQISVAGKSTFEVIPRYQLARNVPTGYSTELPGVAELARDAYINSLGEFRCVYPLDYYATYIRPHVLSMSGGQIAVRAGTVGRRFLAALSAAAPSLIDAGATMVGIASGNPLIGKAVGVIGSGLYNGTMGSGMNRVINNSTVMRNSTLGSQISGLGEDWLPRLNRANIAYAQIAQVRAAHNISVHAGNQGKKPDQQKAVTARSPVEWANDKKSVTLMPTIGKGNYDPYTQSRGACFGQSDCSEVATIFKRVGYMYGRFLGVLGQNIFHGAIVLTPVPATDLVGGIAKYDEVNLGEIRVNIDERIATDPYLQSLLVAPETQAHRLALSGPLYITLCYDGIITGAIAGTSWHTAAMAAIINAPPNAFYVGSATEMLDARDLSVKINYAIEQGIRIYVMAPQAQLSTELANLLSTYGHPMSSMFLGAPVASTVVYSTDLVATWPMILPLQIALQLTGGSVAKSVLLRGPETKARQERHTTGEDMSYYVNFKFPGRVGEDGQEIARQLLRGEMGVLAPYAAVKDYDNWYKSLKKALINGSLKDVENLYRQAYAWVLKNAEATAPRMKTKGKSKGLQASRYRQGILGDNARPEPAAAAAAPAPLIYNLADVSLGASDLDETY